MVKIDNKRYAELLKEKKFLEDNRPMILMQWDDGNIQWVRLLQELELFR